MCNPLLGLTSETSQAQRYTKDSLFVRLLEIVKPDVVDGGDKAQQMCDHHLNTFIQLVNALLDDDHGINGEAYVHLCNLSHQLGCLRHTQWIHRCTGSVDNRIFLKPRVPRFGTI